jgi:hypothetical protein
LAASVPALGALPHCTRMNDNGINADRMAIKRNREPE